MLPGVDGMEVCRRLRERIDTPIIMVTAHGEESDRVLGLEGGADDYIGKPFSSRELLARIRAQARRARGQAGPPGRAVVVGSLRIEPQAMRATFEGRELGLTTYEFTLLRILAERAGRVLGREQLIDLVRGSAEESFDRSIDVHVSHLRQKLGDDPSVASGTCSRWRNDPSSPGPSHLPHRAGAGGGAGRRALAGAPRAARTSAPWTG